MFSSRPNQVETRATCLFSYGSPILRVPLFLNTFTPRGGIRTLFLIWYQTLSQKNHYYSANVLKSAASLKPSFILRPPNTQAVFNTALQKKAVVGLFYFLFENRRFCSSTRTYDLHCHGLDGSDGLDENFFLNLDEDRIRFGLSSITIISGISCMDFYCSLFSLFFPRFCSTNTYAGIWDLRIVS